MCNHKHGSIKMSIQGQISRGKKYHDRLEAGLSVPKQVTIDHPDVKAYLDSPKPEPKPEPEVKEEETGD